ncbi:3438_t:CDS:2 [Rhizophagus irregularis]|nr:3438_t:CDS:2 [Rhizophagus irregularis]
MVLEKSCNTNYKKLKPYLTSPNEFSPTDINTFCGKINHPNPKYTTPTKPKIPWLTSLSMKKGMKKLLKRDEMQNSPTPISNQMG